MEEMVCSGETVFTFDRALSTTAEVAGAGCVVAASVRGGAGVPGLGLAVAVDGRPFSRRRLGASLILGWEWHWMYILI